MKTLVISYDEECKFVNVIDPDADITTNSFVYDDNFEITEEKPDSDCEDFNDNARWLVKTLLAILKLEKEDEWCHCDWTADYDKMPETGKYRFNVSIDKVKELK